MNENLKVTMWSTNNIDTLDLVFKTDEPEFEPTPYVFTKLSNGKKIAVESNSVTPPRWLLLDHTIAVIWLMFSKKSLKQQLNIEDLKWAHELLKEIKNNKGENPPDVKTCLQEIQDKLINLYAKKAYSKEENFDDIAAAFGEKIMADTTTNYFRSCSLSPTRMIKTLESQSDTISVFDSFLPGRTKTNLENQQLLHRHSSKDLTFRPPRKTISSKHKRIAMNYSTKTFPLLNKNSNIFEEPENVDDNDEVEKYIMSFLNDDDDEEKKDGVLQKRASSKSLIPTHRKTPSSVSFSELISAENTLKDFKKKEKTSKKVCVAEMRSLKFQKSMKVQETSFIEGGEETAYSNLKAEIRRLTINPNVSKCEIMKFLKEWRTEQMDRLQNDLKRLNSIEEFIKSVGSEEIQASEHNTSALMINSTRTTSCAPKKRSIL